MRYLLQSFLGWLRTGEWRQYDYYGAIPNKRGIDRLNAVAGAEMATGKWVCIDSYDPAHIGRHPFEISRALKELSAPTPKREE